MRRIYLNYSKASVIQNPKARLKYFLISLNPLWAHTPQKGAGLAPDFREAPWEVSLRIQGAQIEG